MYVENTLHAVTLAANEVGNQSTKLLFKTYYLRVLR